MSQYVGVYAGANPAHKTLEDVLGIRELVDSLATVVATSERRVS